MKKISVFLLLLLPLFAQSAVKVFELQPIPEQFTQLYNIGRYATSGDIDHDGKIDFLFLNYDNEVTLYEQSAIGSLEFELLSSSQLGLSSNLSSLCLHDLDGDGKYELLANEGEVMKVFSQTNSSSYNFSYDYSYNPFPNELNDIVNMFFTCGDITDNTKDDIIAGYNRNALSTPGIPTYYYLYLLSPNGSFFDVLDDNFTNSTFSGAGIPSLTYYDHDDNLDLIVGSAGNLKLFEQNPENPTEFILDSGGFDGIYSSHSIPDFCDLNNDGLDDFILYNAYHGQLKIYLRKLWADWSYEHISGNSYQFNNNSSGDYAVCQWYFDGDNVPDSEEENPVWEFEDDGEHEIHLVLRDGDFCDINTKYISVGTSSEHNEVPGFETSLSNYPNPFNPETTIHYNLENESAVELSIFNIKGQKIKTLVKEEKTMGHHSVVWDGKDDSNNSVSSGIYMYKLRTDRKETTKRMLLLK